MMSMSPPPSDPRTIHRRERTIVDITYVLAFISGAAALIYQVAWVKMISLSFGSTTLAAGDKTVRYLHRALR